MTWLSRNRILVSTTVVLLAVGMTLYDMAAPAQVGYVMACAATQVAAMLLDHRRVMRRLDAGR